MRSLEPRSTTIDIALLNDLRVLAGESLMVDGA